MISEKMEKSLTQGGSVRDIFEEGKKMAEKYGAENVYNFTIGNPSVKTPAIVNETMKDILDHEDSFALHGYPSNIGHPETRVAVADYLKKTFQCSYSMEDIVITSGAAAALSLLCHTVLNPEDEVIAFAPYFWEYRNYVEFSFGKLVESKCHTETLQPEEKAFRNAFSEKTKMVFVNTPNNPTGAIYSEESIKMIASVMEEMQEKYGHPIYLVADEPYRQLVYSNAKVPFIPDYYQNTVVVYSYSKTLSIPGTRVGYLALTPEMDGHDELRGGLVAAIRYLGFVCAPSLQQKMLAKIVDQCVDISVYEKNRDLLYQALIKIGYTCVHPDGAFYLFVKALEEDDEAFCQNAKKEHILMAPGSAFSGPGYARISYCVSEETIKNSLPGFQRLFDSYQK